MCLSLLLLLIIVYHCFLSLPQINPEDSALHSREDSTDSAAAFHPEEEDSEEEAVEEWVEVPYQYQVEETRQKDTFVEEVVEKKIPQVRAMYPYKGNGLDFAKGEVRRKG